MREIVFLLLALTLPGAALAQTVFEPTLLSDDISFESSVNAGKYHAEAKLKGQGDKLSLTYSSMTPFDVFIFFPGRNGEVDPSEILAVTLPPGSNTQGVIPLFHSPAWSPWRTTYDLHFLTESTETVFHGSAFMKASVFSSLMHGVSQALHPEPYTPSIYHRIRGPSFFGIPLTPVFGAVALCGFLLLILKKRYSSALLFLLIFTLLVDLKSSADAVQYSYHHTVDWYTKGTYATAGSLYEISDDLRKEEPSGVFLCSESTSYAPTLLTYLLYPVRISGDSFSHIVVHRAQNWSFSSPLLRCGEKELRAGLLKTYTDGSSLYVAK